MLYTRKFEVELENCETDKIMENQIAANLYPQLEDAGREIFQFKCIIYRKKDGSALKNETGFTVLKGGHRNCKPTTHWSLWSGKMRPPPEWTSKISRKPVRLNWLIIQLPTI